MHHSDHKNFPVGASVLMGSSCGPPPSPAPPALGPHSGKSFPPPHPCCPSVATGGRPNPTGWGPSPEALAARALPSNVLLPSPPVERDPLAPRTETSPTSTPPTWAGPGGARPLSHPTNPNISSSPSSTFPTRPSYSDPQTSGHLPAPAGPAGLPAPTRRHSSAAAPSRTHTVQHWPLHMCLTP